jgi:hypothetical protein
MNGKTINSNVQDTAFHEAAHATMAMMRGAMVYELAILDEPDELGRQGYCIFEKTGSFMRDAWIILAGPAADTINSKVSFLDAFLSGGSMDYEMVRSKFAKLQMPKIPQELRVYIGDDLEDYLNAAFHGWVPTNIRGQMKRKLTLFTKKCFEIEGDITTQIYEEAEKVRDFMINTKRLLEGVTHLAGHLVNVRKMTGIEMINVLKTFYDERNVAT